MCGVSMVYLKKCPYPSLFCAMTCWSHQWRPRICPYFLVAYPLDPFWVTPLHQPAWWLIPSSCRDLCNTPSWFIRDLDYDEPAWCGTSFRGGKLDCSYVKRTWDAEVVLCNGLPRETFRQRDREKSTFLQIICWLMRSAWSDIDGRDHAAPGMGSPRGIVTIHT